MSRSEELKSYLAQLEEVEASLQPWVEKRKPTLFWKIRERIAREKESAVSAEKNAQNRLSAISLPDPSQIMEMRKRFTTTVRNVTLLLIGLLAIYFLVRTYSTVARAWMILNNFGTTRVLTWAISFFISTYIGALLLYYRSWSSYYKQVRVANNEILAFVAEIAHLNDESQRLASVHEQAISWYRLLSLTLIHPWDIGARWLVDPAEKLNVDQIPLAVRFGKAHSGARAIQTSLERTTLENVLRKGWRTEALNNLIEEAALNLGLDPEGFNIRTLDSDLPEASNGARQAFLLQLEKSIRESAGSRKVRELSKFVRESVIPRLATPVKSLHTDALENLDWTYGGADDDNWSGFYSEIYGKGARKAPAFSTLPLTPEGMSRAVHTDFSSFALVPVNTIVEEDGIETVRIDNESPRWIDLSVRIDVAGPHAPSSFKIVRGDGLENVAHSDAEPEQPKPAQPAVVHDWNASFDTNDDGGFN